LPGCDHDPVPCLTPATAGGRFDCHQQSKQAVSRASSGEIDTHVNEKVGRGQ
jgi:hypothetical protein